MKTFRISWQGYPGDPEPETHDQSWFDDGMGFDGEDIEAINALSIGEELHLGGPIDCVTIERLT